MTTFELDRLDHVSIIVKDMERAIAWYEKVLGLQRTEFPKWGSFPIFMLAGDTGVAIFPSRPEATFEPASRHKIVIDHFAFRVTPTNFELARKRYDELGVEYRLVDHSYFVSIYTHDPDGHEVELTCITDEGESFLKR